MEIYHKLNDQLSRIQKSNKHNAYNLISHKIPFIYELDFNVNKVKVNHDLYSIICDISWFRSTSDITDNTYYFRHKTINVTIQTYLYYDKLYIHVYYLDLVDKFMLYRTCNIRDINNRISLSLSNMLHQ